MAAERRNDGSTDVSLQKRKLGDHGVVLWCWVLPTYVLAGRCRPACTSFHFTSLHFLKAPKTGQRTPAALSDSKTGLYM